MKKIIQQLPSILLIIICGFTLWTAYKYHKSNNNYKELQHNYEATIDSLHIEQLKSDSSTLYWKKSYLDNEEVLDLTRKEKREIEKKLDASLAYISKLKGEIHVDTIKIPMEPAPGDSNNIVNSNFLFNYDTPWLKLQGTTDYLNKQLNINNINIPMNLQVGLTEDYKLFCKSDNPYVNITDIQGTTLDKNRFSKPKLWDPKRIGVSVTAGYGIAGKQVGWGAMIGISWTPLIFQW